MDSSIERNTALLEWYGELSVRRVDLVGDYAGDELFLLEGDSLLLRCFQDPKIDFDDGFQLLHAVYAVEYFLNGLAQRKCNFHVVFFDEHEGLCIPRGVTTALRSKYLLARSVCFRHLKVNLPKNHPSIQVRSFPSIQDSLFSDYLRTTGIYFLMCHDGADEALLVTNSVNGHASDIGQLSLDDVEVSRKLALRKMIWLFINQGYNIALINGLEWQDTKVMAMVVEGLRAAKNLLPFEGSDSSTKQALEAGNESFSVEQSLSGLGMSTENVKLDEIRCKCQASETASHQGMTERGYLIIVALARMLENDSQVQDLATILLAHHALLNEIPLAKRRLEVEINNRAEKFLTEFSKVSRSVLQEGSWCSAMERRAIPCDICDLVDGRTFYAVSRPEGKGLYTPRLISSFDQHAHFLCAISGIHLALPTDVSHSTATLRSSNEPAHGSLEVLPFSNPVFDKHLASISIATDPRKGPDRQTGRIYQEITHWHNAKRQLNPKHAPELTGREKGRALRRNQFFMAEMQAYAASLTNAAGKALEPEIVTVGGKPPSGKENAGPGPKPSTRETGSKPATNRKAAPKQAMLNNIAANKEQKDSDNADKVFSAWRTVRKNLDSERQLRAKYTKIKAYLRDLPEAKRKVLQAEVEWHLFCVLLTMYQGLRKGTDTKNISQNAELWGVAALLWDTARRLSSVDGLTKTIAQQLKDVVQTLNLPDVGVPSPSFDRRLASDPGLWLPKGNGLEVGLGGQDFQLLHCGPYMDRNLDSAPDSRVPFEPDGWQRQVLDELDAQRSVFVVAPTSAGKTFISFYAMEKILRSNDDSILVYVAPTKALVNQIAAEVQARFRKTYKHAGKSVWAIHTRDYRINNPSGCQILVTVPHILQIMLLAPSNAKSWSPRVKYIIFDEIHSIGQAEDGVVWEQLLLLAPCPIIALSATVGNPKAFDSWLTSTQKSSGYDMRMIQHQHRYSDLRKFVYRPPKHFVFNGLADRPSFATLGLDGIDGLSFVHPVASLVNKSRGIPEDLSLEARDCHSLYKTMSRHQFDKYPVDSALDPSNGSFPVVIKKKDIINWEESLKYLLRQWMADDKSPFDRVVDDLSRSMDEPRKGEKQFSKGDQAEANTEDMVEVEQENLYSTTLPLLCQLHERDALPAIFFNYERNKCEGICKAVVNQLEVAEARFKESSTAWKNKISGWEQWKKQKSKMGAKKPVKVASSKKSKAEDDGDPSSKTEKMQDAAGDETDPYAGFNPEDPVEGFHFAAKHKAEVGELDRYFYQMRRRNLPEWLMDGLKRGIGVHHAGMNRKYRQVVEMLFRKGYLRVVIATGTLALGINMPCATVVFSGDSVFLTALNFRQAAGRAGRRGFDLLGNVVFQGVSRGKICRLLSSRLPDLNGHFPVTTTLVLRLFSLLHESEGSAYAVRAINSLLSQPRLYLDGPAFRDQVLHHLRFSIEYLRRQNLLSAQGAPINFAGLTSHLYFTENSSFALNALIKEGYFHELCNDISDNESSVLRDLMLVLAHLFGRRLCRQADSEYVENIVKRSPSIVFLPELPAQATRVLRQHNEDTLQTFTTYVKTFVDQHIKAADCNLPLTGLQAGGSNEDLQLPGSLPPTKIRSAFVALSGHGDKFESISDLCRTTRSGVFLEEAVIPHLDVYPDESKTPLNAYLYDFYMHGDLDALEKANGVRKSDVWFLLNDFSMVLATITASLANFLKLPESDLSLLDVIGEGDEHANLEDDKFAADSNTDTESTAASTATADTGRTSLSTASTVSKAKSKKVVVDSWEDDAEAQEKEEPENVNVWEGGDASKEELEKGFLNIYKAVVKLRGEFDTKFRKIFA